MARRGIARFERARTRRRPFRGRDRPRDRRRHRTPPIGGHARGSTGRSRRSCCSRWSSRSSCTTSCTPRYSWNRDEPVVPVDGQRAAVGADLHIGRRRAPVLPALAHRRARRDVLLAVHAGLAAASSPRARSSSAPPAFAIVLGAGLAVLGTYLLARELTGNHALALVSAAHHGGVTDPRGAERDLPQLPLLARARPRVRRGVPRRAPSPAALAARRRRAVLGYLFMTRPFDAVLWAAPFVAVRASTRQWGRWRPLLRAVLWSRWASSRFAIATLVYNRHVTGSFTEFPITVADPLDTFGFGTKSIATRWPTTPFGLRDAVRGRRAQPAQPAAVPLRDASPVCVVAAVGLWLRRRDRSTIALLLARRGVPGRLLLLLGHLPVGGVLVGVRADLLPPAVRPALHPDRDRAAVDVAAASRASRSCSSRVLVGRDDSAPRRLKLDQNHSISVAQEPWRDAETRSTGARSCSSAYSGPYLLHLNPFSENPPDLDGRILYADRPRAREPRPHRRAHRGARPTSRSAACRATRRSPTTTRRCPPSPSPAPRSIAAPRSRCAPPSPIPATIPPWSRTCRSAATSSAHVEHHREAR